MLGPEAEASTQLVVDQLANVLSEVSPYLCLIASPTMVCTPYGLCVQQPVCHLMHVHSGFRSCPGAARQCRIVQAYAAAMTDCMWGAYGHQLQSCPAICLLLLITELIRCQTHQQFTTPIHLRTAQVGDGIMEFTPIPESSRALIASQYKVPRTLLVRFADDPIDETPLIAAALRQTRPQGEACQPLHNPWRLVLLHLEARHQAGRQSVPNIFTMLCSMDRTCTRLQHLKRLRHTCWTPAYDAASERSRYAGLVDITLPGSHGTPCGVDVTWQVRLAQAGPAEALIHAPYLVS